MASNEPQDTAGQLDAEGIPEEDLPPGMEGTGGDYEEEATPRDCPVAALDFGTTAAEQAAGESLERRVAREHQDVLAGMEQPGDVDLSRTSPEDERLPDDDDLSLTEEGLDDDDFDGTDDIGAERLVAFPDEDGRLLGAPTGDHSGLAAEELAMHLEPEEP